MAPQKHKGVATRIKHQWRIDNIAQSVLLLCTRALTTIWLRSSLSSDLCQIKSWPCTSSFAPQLITDLKILENPGHSKDARNRVNVNGRATYKCLCKEDIAFVPPRHPAFSLSQNRRAPCTEDPAVSRSLPVLPKQVARERFLFTPYSAHFWNYCCSC